MRGSLLPLLVLAFPLGLALLAPVPAVRARALWLLPVAPLPALALALLAGDAVGETGVVLLGTVLGLDWLSRPFLGFAALLWSAAGLFAAVQMRGDRRQAVFAGFWCLTLAGNLGVFLARDVATFYVSFAAVSLAAYVLVVHDGTQKVLRAGRIYLALTVFGETCLLAALLIGVSAAPGLLIEDVRAGIAASPLRDVAVGLLVVAFGLKAGLMPLHVWLPLAHPAAPVPASAVLSGAIVKAGIFGLLVFLPAGSAGWGGGLLVAGLAGAYLAVLLGIPQRDAKAVLAYSTVSQIGLVVALIGAGLAAGDPRPALGAAALYCLHHGLAKGALFLSVGVMPAAGGRHRYWVLAAAAFAALSVAGLPVTGGALAKAAMKDAVAVPWAVLAVTLSAAGTSLLLLRFLVLLNRKAASRSGPPPPGLVAPLIALVTAALALPWLLLPSLSHLPPSYAFGGAALWNASWPLALAAATAAAALHTRLQAPEVPEGDLAVPLERAAAAAIVVLGRLQRPEGKAAGARDATLLRRSAVDPYAGGGGGHALLALARRRGIDGVRRVENALGAWPRAGLLLVAFALVLFAGLLA